MLGENERERVKREWFGRGDRDLEAAKLLKQYEGHANAVAVFLEQAAEKYLKGYLLIQGWKLRKTHDLEVLVTEAAKHDGNFQQFLSFARSTSAYYYDARYPPGPPVDFPRTEIDEMLAQTEKLVSKIKDLT